MRSIGLAVSVATLALAACSRPSGTATTTSANKEPIPAPANDAEDGCHLVSSGYGPDGNARVKAEVVVEGLVTPWSIAFLPNHEMLVTERPGRIRLVRDGKLVPEPVANVPAAVDGESGLMGLAVHPKYADNGVVYGYYTIRRAGELENVLARFRFDPKTTKLKEAKTVVEGIPAEEKHDGGRIKFGPDGMLYVATGDAGNPPSSQDPKHLAGKLLRYTAEATVPKDNPFPDSAAWLIGIRNLQAFDWLDDGRIVLADHGPSGEMGRRGHDEISVASRGANLGWPGTWGCERKDGVVTPLVVFDDAMPPGGGVLYRGEAIPAWKNSFLVASLKGEHLHRFEIDAAKNRVTAHEVYLKGKRPSGFGRLRDVVTGPDGAIYVTTSNCDTRGDCPGTKDAIVRITAL